MLEFGICRLQRAGAAIAAVVLAAGCSNYGGTSTALPAGNAARAQSLVSAADGGDSILKRLKKQVVIGSTVDPKNGAGNPYGLTVAPVSDGDFTKGDLVVCNFNDKANVQGTGRSIIALHNKPGSKPISVSSIKSLKGCDALALGGNDTIWAASMVANDNPVIDTMGGLIQNIKGKPFKQPWGQAFATPTSGAPAFYETNAGNGSVVRINLGSLFTYDVIATGFPVNHGKPGTALAPSGLSYDVNGDVLYFADGMNNTIVAFSNVSSIPAGGIKAKHNGMDFSGPSASDARIVYSGAPLNGPISTALLLERKPRRRQHARSGRHEPDARDLALRQSCSTRSTSTPGPRARCLASWRPARTTTTRRSTSTTTTTTTCRCWSAKRRLHSLEHGSDAPLARAARLSFQTCSGSGFGYRSST